jgi:hypothetical protein
MAPFTVADNEALKRLVTALGVIADTLRGWQAPQPAGQVPAGTPHYDLGEVATAFEAILIELKEKSGPDGHEVYQRLGAIAHQLRAAANALQEE